MPRFDDNDPSQRRAKATKAKEAMLARFKTSASESDPEIAERRAARLAVSQEREKRNADRAEAKRLEAERQAAAQKAQEEENARLAIEKAESDAAERRAIADRELEILAEQKAARDARYAARKARR